MAPDADDAIRLKRIERDLVKADPVLAEALRRWQPPPECTSPEWSTVPAWALMVFLVGFATWIIGPAAGMATALIMVVCWARSADGRSRWRRGASNGGHRNPPPDDRC